MWYTKKRQVKESISDRTLFVGGHGMGKGLNVKDESLARSTSKHSERRV